MSIRSYKVVLLGNSGVGKTSLAYRMKFDSFRLTTEPTIGCEFFAHTHTFSDDTKIKFLIWDTSGQEVFKSFTPQFCRNARLGLILYDVESENNPNLTDELKDWIRCVPDDCMILTVPTKQDVPTTRYSSKVNSEKFLSTNREVYFAEPTSSKENRGVTELIAKMGSILRPLLEKTEINVVAIEKAAHKDKKCCSI